MRHCRTSASLIAALALCTVPALENSVKAQTTAASRTNAADDISRGRYMVLTGHCNNCHTANYTAKQSNVPEKDWLLGNPVGFRSDAGTTYASNLRLTVQNFTEEQWASYAKGTKPRPPMPWWSLHDTTERDLRAMYSFIKSLGPAGQVTPDFVPADKDPPPPYEVRRFVR